MKKRIFITVTTGLLGKSILNQMDDQHFEITIGSWKKKVDHQKYKWQLFDLDNFNSELNFKEIDIVLHLASNTTDLRADSDLTGIKQIIKVALRDQLNHLIIISIVGVGKIPVKYFKTKRKKNTRNCSH